MNTTSRHRVGWYLACLQFFFAITWTVYVIFLPRLAQDAGLPRSAVLYLLLLDQLIFAVMDFAMGLMADRVAQILGRLGHIVLGVTLVSCIAFLLLPFAAPHGVGLFLALTVLWSATSSALRAPPLVLLGKYSPPAAVPWLSGVVLFGIGVAGALGPYLTIALRDADPRWPFALSTIALGTATAGIIWGERTLAASTGASSIALPAAEGKPVRLMSRFLIAIALVSLGFQIHFAINSAPLYLRHAKPEDLEFLMPVFWVGFNLLMLPAALATQRYGGLVTMTLGSLVAGLAALLVVNAGRLDLLVTGQFIAGAAWGCVLMSAVASAIAIGHTGNEGKVTGALFSLLAVAAFARIAMLAAELDKLPHLGALLNWAPALIWGFGGLLLLSLIPAQRRLART